jgi:hypothetical protein
MSWKIFAERLDTSDLSVQDEAMGDAPGHTQKCLITDNMVLKAVRTWVVFFNAPVFSSLELRIYPNDVSYYGSPPLLKRIYTSSNSWTLPEIATEDYAAKELYFEFDQAVNLIGGETYKFAIWANDYTGDATSHIAWVRATNDCAYSGYVEDSVNNNTAPFKLALIGVKT